MITETRPRNFDISRQTSGCFTEFGGKFLLLKRAQDKKYPNKWALPGGKVDEGENPRQAILRESLEETGIDISGNVAFYKTMYERYKEADFLYHIFRAVLDRREQVIISPNEHSEYTWVSPQEALKMDLIQDLDVCIKLVYPIGE